MKLKAKEIAAIELPARNPPRLDQWEESTEYGFPCLRGIVYGHPSIPDGEHVRTSRLLWISKSAGCAQTLNTLYRLLKPKE